VTAWPLPKVQLDVPIAGHPGSFGAVRKHDIHTGVDLYCEPYAIVAAVERGEVVKIEEFTGPKAGSPWWNRTLAVWVHSYDHDRTIVYGEVSPMVEEGDSVEAGEHIALVRTVLKKDKGLPRTMLHFEMYEGLPEETAWWHHGQPRPTGLLDPTQLLLEALGG